MRWAILIVGGLGWLGLFAVSAAMNWRFGFSLGNTEFDGHILGAGAIALDLMKVCLPFCIAMALRERTPGPLLIRVVLFVCFMVLSLAATLGFNATNRAQKFGERQALATITNSQLSTVQNGQKELTNLRKQLSGKLHWRDRRIKQKRVRELEASIVEATKALSFSLNSKTAVTIANPQAQAFANLSGLNEQLIETWLVWFIAIVMELGAALGSFAILRSLLPVRSKIIQNQIQTTGNPPIPGGDNDGGKNVVPLPERTNVERSVRTFLKVLTEGSKGSIAPATALHQAYCRYASEHNFPELKQRAFGQILTALGYQRDRRAPKGVFAYLDIELKRTA